MGVAPSSLLGLRYRVLQSYVRTLKAKIEWRFIARLCFSLLLLPVYLLESITMVEQDKMRMSLYSSKYIAWWRLSNPALTRADSLARVYLSFNRWVYLVLGGFYIYYATLANHP